MIDASDNIAVLKQNLPEDVLAGTLVSRLQLPRSKQSRGQRHRPAVLAHSLEQFGSQHFGSNPRNWRPTGFAKREEGI